MEKLEINGTEFTFDVEKTREYYKSNEVCDCAYCLQFRHTVRNLYPELAAYLARFGIDIARPDETGPVDLEESILYYFVGYTVCGSGSAPEGADEEISIAADGKTLKLTLGTGFQFPNNQKEEYFSLTVYDLYLPRVNVAEE
ncbi:MAG: hypothetical protein IJK77_02725 [Lachnospiraceae bacterium]|nr:hypothetical protein [Lachnospiraceae bacterium]